MLGSAPSSTVNAVLTMSATVASREGKGNAASLHHAFVTAGAVDQLFTGVAKGPDELRWALSQQHICLSDAQIKDLCTSKNKDDFFLKLLAIQKAEIQSYLNMQKKGPTGAVYTTTPTYYNELLQQLNGPTANIAKPSDYANLLKDYNAAPNDPNNQDKKKQTKGQLMLVMNREYDLYTTVNPKVDFGSKADHVRFHYYAKQLQGLSAPPAAGSMHAHYKKFIDDKASEFPGGFHAKVDITYQHKSPASAAKDPLSVGKSHRITIVNLGIPKKQLVDIINGVDSLASYGVTGKQSPTQDVRFSIAGAEYAIAAVYNGDDKPIIFQKVKLDASGNRTKEVSELTAEESEDIKAGATQLKAPYDKCTSVTHAIAMSFKNTKELMMGLTPNYGTTPIVTSNMNKTGVGMGIQPATPTSSLSIRPGSAAPPVGSPLFIRPGTASGASPVFNPRSLDDLTIRGADSATNGAGPAGIIGGRETLDQQKQNMKNKTGAGKEDSDDDSLGSDDDEAEDIKRSNKKGNKNDSLNMKL